MSERTKAFQRLADAAEEIYDDREPSLPGEQHTLDNPRDTDAYAAVLAIQALYDGKLPGHGWEAWVDWLLAYESDDYVAYYAAVYALEAWAAAEAVAAEATGTWPSTDSVLVEESIVQTLDDVTPDPNRWAYMADCRCVNWYGRLFTFTATQAACVKAMVKAYIGGVPEIGEQTLLENEWVGSAQNHLSQVFDKGKHPAWGTMIRPGSTKGTFRLAKPDK